VELAVYVTQSFDEQTEMLLKQPNWFEKNLNLFSMYYSLIPRLHLRF